MRILTYSLSFLLCLAAHSPAFAQGEWPQDALDVSYTVAARIAHMPTPNNITFAQGVEAYMESTTSGYYATFKNGGAIPVYYQNYGTGSSYSAEVMGVIHLFDPVGRIATLQFLAQYTVKGKSITITQCLAATSSPSKLTMEVYTVSAFRFRNALPPAKRGDWSAVYNFAKENTYNPQKDSAKKDTYLVMTFVKNRLPKDAVLEVIVNDKKTAKRALDNLAKDKEAYLDYDGWRVHMFSAKFLPTSMKERFFSNYYYTPGTGFIDKMRKREQVAQYTSKPSATGPNAPMQGSAQTGGPTPSMAQQPAFAPAPAPAPAPQYQQSARPSSGSGPIERGVAFLNPIFPEDTTLIQTRLKELGHYSGPIDHDFGPLTQKALDNFADRNKLPRGQWSLTLQKALFRGSGL